MATRRTVTFDEAVALTAAMRTAWLRMVNKRLKEAPSSAEDWSFDVEQRAATFDEWGRVTGTVKTGETEVRAFVQRCQRASERVRRRKK